MRGVVFSFLILFSSFSFSQIERIEPPNWWVGFKNNELELLVKGETSADGYWNMRDKSRKTFEGECLDVFLYHL